MRPERFPRPVPPLGLLADIQAIGYLRVSTERQAGEVFTSLADQEAAVARLAAKLGVSVGRWFRDEGASGATVAKRPAFSQLLAACEASPRSDKDPGLVLALNDSRFSRGDPDEAAWLRYRLKQCGWLVRFAENDDAQDVTTRSVLRAINSAQAYEYRQNLMRNSRRGMKGAAEQGFWTREAPLGYRRAVVYPPGRERILERGSLKSTDEKVRLVPETAREAPLVRWMFETYASGTHSLGGLVRELETRCRDRAWSRRTVQAVLKNAVYAGDVIGGRRRDDPSPELYGKHGAHEALVSRALFETVQARLALNRRQTRAAGGGYLLSGLVRCAHCGRPYIGGGLGGRLRDGTRPRFYKDSGSLARVPVCPGPMGTVTREILDGAVLKLLAAEIAKPAIREAITTALDDALSGLPAHATDTAASARRRRATLERQRDNLVAAIAEGLITRGEAAARLERLRSELAQLEETQQRAQFARRGAVVAQPERDRLLSLAFDFPALVRRLNGPALRELVRPWLEDAVFRKDSRRLTVVIRKVPALPGLQLFTGPGRG